MASAIILMTQARRTHILVSKMLQKLQFSVCPFRQDWSAERLHNLLDRNSLAGELIFGRAGLSISMLVLVATLLSKLTILGRMLPCPQVEDQYILTLISCVLFAPSVHIPTCS